jgi:hypothetical protein
MGKFGDDPVSTAAELDSMRFLPGGRNPFLLAASTPCMALAKNRERLSSRYLGQSDGHLRTT